MGKWTVRLVNACMPVVNVTHSTLYLVVIINPIKIHMCTCFNIILNFGPKGVGRMVVYN